MTNSTLRSLAHDLGCDDDATNALDAVIDFLASRISLAPYSLDAIDDAIGCLLDDAHDDPYFHLDAEYDDTSTRDALLDTPIDHAQRALRDSLLAIIDTD